MRVFFVGFRADEDKLWTPPAKTHSADGSGTRWPSATGRSGPRTSRSNAADLLVYIESQARDRSDECFRCSEKNVTK